MDADVIKALKTQAAYLAGNRDRPIIIVKSPAAELKSTWKKQPLDLCLQYLISSLSKETVDSELNIIIDIQLCSWRYARNTIQYVNELLNNKNAKFYAVRAEAFGLDNCTKAHQYMDVSVVTKLRLLKYFKSEELPEELGGSLSLNHEQWLKSRIRIEDFRKSFNKVIVDLDNFIESMQDLKTMRPTEISEILKRRSGTNIEMQNIVKMIIKNGNKLLLELNDSLNKNYCKTRDIIDARESIKRMLNKMEQKQMDFSAIWCEFETYLSNLKVATSLIDNIGTITKWIMGKGEELISEQHKIGADLETSEALRDAHDALEMKCCDTYGYYAELNFKIQMFTSEKDSITANSVTYKDLLAQKQFMDFLCRSFANRLEKRRIILITCVRFYRLVTTYFERTSQVWKQNIVGNKLFDYDMCMKKLKSLRESNNNLERMVDELEKEGEKLSDLLSMPVKDVLGRDTGVDYTDEISVVRDILQETTNRRRIFSESFELQTLTFEQIISIYSYEKDAMMASKWIDDLLAITIKTHSYVGCNIFEIQRQKQNLQNIQQTARRIFDYGNQLLEASMALRINCKLDDSQSREKMKSLLETWKSLENISQEQLCRLRVSSVFHRTMEEHCQQLKDLKETIEAESEYENKEEKLLRLRLHMLNREQLILEIGRMVRLGKLLRSRLKEPFGKIEDESDSALPITQHVESNMIAANAITGKLNEVSKIAESLDVALRETQTILELDIGQTNSLERKIDGNTSIDSRGSIDELNSFAKSSTEDESFMTASECTLTPHSHSSSYETASEGGLMSPWASSGTDKNSFETCSSSDSEVPSMQLLSGVISSAINSFYDSDNSFQSIYNSSEDVDDDLNSCTKNKSIECSDLSDVFIKATKHTVKGCL
ncbi:SEC14 domain and spectrin repeat-containing protein 1-B [Contarinia nasturtii]|uniref:SEC14 domain and spectrin repeat-containing protein 1-B n=1 Tax=Contarinia nasturtii TaxID=265458 RepID=UPI0012D3DE20|nr:SEC14 domain and spectrin repeat-containing protein 1-B [Contarinia nasturtii]XP_031619563.1 SEC14 domain and spectrin repeat-containing protein 1-B [Contarinia nasturtii]